MKKVLLVIILLVILLSACGCKATNEDTEPVATQQDAEPAVQKEDPKTVIIQDFAVKLVNKLKPQLKDPNSFECINTEDAAVYYVEEDGFFATRLAITYTATNSYGGRIQNTYYGGAWGHYDHNTEKVDYDTILTDDDALIFFVVSGSDWEQAIEESLHQKE